MTVQATDGAVTEATCSLPGEVLEWDAVPRLGIARRIEKLEDEEAAELAERYQIGSRHTSFVLVHKRAEGERAEALPELKTVRQMLAAGWGGSGSVMAGARLSMGVAQLVRGPSVVVPGARAPSRLYSRSGPASPDFSASMEPIEAESIRPEQAPEDVLMTLLEELDRGGSLPKSYKDLERLGVPAGVLEQLRLVGEREGFLAARVVRAFIALLAERYAGEIGRPEASGIADEAFRRGAHGMLRMVLEPLVEWSVAV